MRKVIVAAIDKGARIRKNIFDVCEGIIITIMYISRSLVAFIGVLVVIFHEALLLVF